MSKYPRWFWIFAAVTLLLSALPYLYAWAIQPEGTLYLGVHSNYDDHCVYAAWMKQAQEGRFFFDNRFTNDPQPRLTINLYFWLAGTLARVVGIPLADHICKAVFGLFFLMALYGLVRRLSDSKFTQIICMCVAVFGAGVGWAMWHRYGQAGDAIDIWQPEAFTFPSLMQNALFCVALWLMCLIWNKILDAQDSWKPVLAGAIATLLLTNIHTYDTLTVAIVGVGFLFSQIAVRTGGGLKGFVHALTEILPWLLRTAVIAMGAIPAVLWFLYVRAKDPVFRLRGETGTFSPSFFAMLLGYAPILILAFACFIYLRSSSSIGKWAPILATLFLVAIAISQRFTGFDTEHLWLDVIPWFSLFLIAAILCYLYKPAQPIHGLLFAWTLLNLVAMYYPGAFQRKLAMGLSVPIGIAAGFILATALEKIPHIENRRSLAALAVFLLGLTSVRWIERESQMANDNISNSTMQRIFWEKDVAEILAYLREHHTEEDCVIGHPGQAVPYPPDAKPLDSFLIGIPNIDPVMTGWAGVKSWAGHWSETPDCRNRKGMLSANMFSQYATEESARDVLQISRATYIIVPTSATATAFHVPPLSFFLKFGKAVYAGPSFALVHVQ